MKKLTQTEVINRFNELHNNCYNYSKFNYTKAEDKSIIICETHGEFLQSYIGHYCKKTKCPKCSYKHRTDKISSDIFCFLNRAIKTHGEKYDYSLSEYKNSRTKIVINCKSHGNFDQKPSNHLNGQGCPRCANIIKSSVNKEFPTSWSYTNWQKAAERSKNFDSFKVYILECTDPATGERFFKIGKTYTTIKKRFKTNKKLPYQHVISKIYYFNNAKKCSEFEKALQNKYKGNKYNPKNKFKGMNECFSKLTK